ncbi:hypothetical protein EGC76_11495 [Pseudidiomarina gelatinasegens]|uniref:Uncharacterized protein n=1 Tax=Pseudidiomarina gelatinasegens TaxID=2487740 RepID=A0A443YVW6_9GAMM|nr:hypothetical protein [Pseudidiomarina gelatinasegens]RWU08077.1 hypothetical protein EGC76_11495 [Pseudidiomarina gelatinasegens]
MKTKWIVALLYLVSLTSSAGAKDLIGQRYQDFQKDLPEFKQLSGSCLSGCKYSVSNVKDLSNQESVIVLSKNTQGSKRWEIVDVLENPKGQATVSNCTENYSSFKQMQATTPGLMPSNDNSVALIRSTSEKAQDNKLWVKATQVFTVDIESHTFTEISNDDVYCYVGIG